MNSNRAVNWKALQVYGCMKPDFSPPKDVNVSQMAGGAWKANLHKEGHIHHRSSGGLRKRTMKSKITIGPFYKEKIFNPVKKVIQ